MWLPCKFSTVVRRARGARTDTSKIQNNKTHTEHSKQQSNFNSRHSSFTRCYLATSDAIHRVRIPYSKFHLKNVSQYWPHIFAAVLTLAGHTRFTRFFSLSKRANDARGSLIRMRAWSSRNSMASQTCKRRKHALTFLVFPSVNFSKSLYTSWYRYLLHNIIFWQNFI